MVYGMGVGGGGEQIHDKHILPHLKEYDHALPLIYLILKITVKA